MTLALVSEKDFENTDFDLGHEVKLQNSFILNNPNQIFSHLSESQAKEMEALMLKFTCIFSDVPKLCSAAVHDVS